MEQQFSILFQSEFEKLNLQQKIAVETTEGPVMVIAGPGTGKTQVLSIRIANLLYQGLANADNILCLTYTEAGAIAMQRRLSKFIGSISNQISIHTFHSFCSRVISENPVIFNIRKELKLAEKIDEYEILENILLQLNSKDILYRHDQNYQSSLWSILELIHTIKKESWDINQIKLSISKHIEELKYDERFIYKRAYGPNKAGDLKQKEYEQEKDRFKKTLSVLDLIPSYLKTLKEQGLYDFNDLINNVIENFEKSEELLGYYQEKFQYILVDEFQDTNGSQLKILDLLLSYWDQPNVFVVGDSDQAIYRFQGANTSNLNDFQKKYNPIVISLQENYRSTQSILNLSEDFVSQNKERALSEFPKKALISNSPRLNLAPVLKIFNSHNEEVIEITKQIEYAINNDRIPPDKIAVLFRKNNEAITIAKELQSKGIAYSFSKEINVLDHPIVIGILKFLEYIESEYRDPFQNDYLLYELMHTPFINISTLDIGQLAYYLRNLKSDENNLVNNLRIAIGKDEVLESAKVSDKAGFLNLADTINRCIKEKQYYTLQVLIEKVMYELGIIPFILQQDNSIELLEILNSFYEYIKTLSVRYDDITITYLDQHLQKLKKYKLSIPYLYVLGDNSKVRLGTIHSSKGLEYNRVFLMNNVKQRQNNSSIFKLPPGFSYLGAGTDPEEERRLFYVGMTRAEQVLHISYSTIDNSGKLKDRNDSIKELESLQGLEIYNVKLEISEQQGGLLRKLSFFKKELELISNDKIDKFLESFELSVTSLEKYLQCPIAFYYEKILRVPGARNAYMGFGRAVHSTLEEYFREWHKDYNYSIDGLASAYEKNLRNYSSHFTKEEYKSYLEIGKERLSEFVHYFKLDWKNVNKVSVEVDYRRRTYAGVPISGKLDRIDDYDDGIIVIDYKTGRPDQKNNEVRLKGPSKTSPYGGEYWRQMVFYSILCDTDSQFKSWKAGTFYYVIPDKKGQFKKHSIEVTDEDKGIVKSQIVETYTKITNREFNTGCRKKDCRWCQFLELGDLKEIEEEMEDE